MRKFYLLFSILISTLIISSCADNQTRIGEGAVLGGLLGAGAGAIIGHQSNDDAAGVLIGGAVGAASGAVIGSQISKESKDQDK